MKSETFGQVHQNKNENETIMSPSAVLGRQNQPKPVTSDEHRNERDRFDHRMNDNKCIISPIQAMSCDLDNPPIGYPLDALNLGRNRIKIDEDYFRSELSGVTSNIAHDQVSDHAFFNQAELEKWWKACRRSWPWWGAVRQDQAIRRNLSWTLFGTIKKLFEADVRWVEALIAYQISDV